MRYDPENATADDGARRDRTRGEPSNTRSAEPIGRVTRRRALAATGIVALGTTAGCLDSVLSIGDTRVEVQPEAPGEDPDATPEEFYYQLEDAGITVDELYHDTADDDLILFYESEAEDPEESDEEILEIYEVFRDDLVEQGTAIELLFTEVRTNFDEQVEGWGANSQWAEMELDGNASIYDVLIEINGTKVYPDGVDAPEAPGDDFGDPGDGVIEIGEEDGIEFDDDVPEQDGDEPDADEGSDEHE